MAANKAAKVSPMYLLCSSSRFPHRTNRDGTIDSICPHCFATIGTSTWEADLEDIEAAHICDPARLTYYKERRKPVAKDAPPQKEKPGLLGLA